MVRRLIVIALLLILFTIEGRSLLMVRRDGSRSPQIRNEEKVVKMLRREIGSRPPSCEKRCNNKKSSACEQCEAVQVPTTISISLVSNIEYKPITWKCKCGSSLFNP